MIRDSRRAKEAAGTGDERRRRWSEEDRVRILAAIEEPGAVVAEVARREDTISVTRYGARHDPMR